MSHVVYIDRYEIRFNDGSTLYSDHDQDCCEHHYLSFSDLTLQDFEGLEFDLTKDDFFTRVENYGITLNPKNGHPVSVPGYGSNNGYYSDNLNLVVKIDGNIKTYDITSCQVVEG